MITGNIGANPGLAALWEDEKQRRRDQGQDSQLTPLQSQGIVGLLLLLVCCYCYELRFVLVVTPIARYRWLAVVVSLLLLLGVTFCVCIHFNRKVSSACCYCYFAVIVRSYVLCL